MTKNEKLAIAEHIRSIASGMTYNGSNSEGSAKHKLYEWAMVLTVDAHAMAPSIAQSIRDAAINWDLSKPLSDVERRLLDAFCESSLESFESKDHLLWGNAKEKHHARTFMLLVAEALE